MVFFSALVPFALVAVLFGVVRLRAPLAGLAAGVAGHLLFHVAARVTDVQGIPGGPLVDEIWLVLNAIACVSIAILALRR